jgi:DNA-binding transcriptional LysR family regulator
MDFENIHDLRVALACRQSGSLTAAAARLGITPAAASAALKRLEARVGARLFERTTRSMRITPQGERYADYAQRALELLEEARGQLAADTDAQRLAGGIRLDAPSDLARNVLLPWLDAFLERHPGVELHLAVSDARRDPARGQVDIALRYGDLRDARLVARRLCDTRRLACAAPAYLARHPAPAHPSALAGHECLAYLLDGRPSRTWRFERRPPAAAPAPMARAGAEAGAGPSAASDGAAMPPAAARTPGTAPAGPAASWAPEVVEVRVGGRRTADDAEIAHRWALAGRGVLCKSAIDLGPSLASGALVPLLPGWQGEPLALHALLPSHRFVPARVRRLVDFLAERFAALPLA